MTVTRGILYETSSGGVLYEVSTGRVLYDNSGTYKITADDYFTRSQPAKSEELKNRVQVRYSPLVEGTDDEVYRSDEPISLAAGASITIDAEYSNVPCIDAVADLDSKVGSTFSITADDYYSWGARVTVQNTGGASGTCELFITAKPLTIEGESYKTAEDTPSIAENGVLEYKFPDNHLVQNGDNAQAIADNLVTSFATPHKDTSVNWRGDPALELGDEITVPTYQRGATTLTADFYIFKNKIDFDGTLKSTTEGRKL
jgi:hypothetical protein